MRRVFSLFDKDGNGEIDRKELRQVFNEMGREFSDEEVQVVKESQYIQYNK